MPIELVDRVTFELSNVCNYAHLHARCPAHFEKKPENLPAGVVFSVLEELSGIGFSGCFAFHQYSEPLVDPRLFMFLERTKAACPDSPILIWTNGRCLDQSMVEELETVGVTSLCITSYTPEEKKRLRLLESDRMIISHFGTSWIEVLGIYDLPLVDNQHPCYAPFTDVTITRAGMIGLCCRDWQRRHTFADLSNVSFVEAASGAEICTLYHELSHSVRKLDICRRCRQYRDWRGAGKGRRRVTFLPSAHAKEI